MISLNLPLTDKPFIALESSSLARLLELPAIFSCKVAYKGAKNPKTRYFRIYETFLLISETSDFGKSKAAFFSPDMTINFKTGVEGKSPSLVKRLQSLVVATDEKRKELWPLDPANMTAIHHHLRLRCKQSNFLEIYQVFKKIGSGATSKVYLCRNSIDQQEYAVKSISKLHIMAMAEPRNLLALENEISILKSLDHVGISKLESYFETDRHYFLVFELFRSGNLKNYLYKNGPLSEQIAAKLFLSILESLLYLHRKNIMHRDIKPENLLFRSNKQDSKNQIVIADFGLATRNDVDKYIFARCGTPGYVAPEVWRTEASWEKYGLICDLFSFGVTLLESLTGKKPGFDNKTWKTKRFSYDFEKHPRFEKLSKQAQNLIERTICEPEQRIGIEDALAHPFFKGLQIEDLEEEDLEVSVQKNIEDLKKRAIHLEAKNVMVLSPCHSPVFSPKNRREGSLVFVMNEHVFTGLTQSIKSISMVSHKGGERELEDEELVWDICREIEAGSP